MGLTEYFVRHYTLVLDNNEVSHGYVTELANGVVQASGITLSEYKALSTRERDEKFASEIGDKVIDAIRDYWEDAIDENSRSIGGQLAGEIMILGDTDIEYALGHHYMPENGDAEDFLSDDEDDESDD